jgi:hypothetical protein
MTFTVDDFQDLIRLLEQRPEWRAELRRHVLSEELLELPTVVRQLADRVDQLAQQLAALTARVDQLAAGQAQLVEGQTQLAASQGQLAAGQAQLAAGQAQLVEGQAQLAERQTRSEQRLERIEVVLERLVEAQDRTESRVGRLEGDVLELRYARRGPAYFGRLARRLRVIEPGVLADLLDEAVAEGRLTEAERDTVLDADLVFAGRRREDGAEVYLLAEISAGIRPHDVERAADRATLLQKLGRPVTPIVAGWQINAEAAILAAERGVVHVLNGQVARPLTS